MNYLLSSSIVASSILVLLFSTQATQKTVNYCSLTISEFQNNSSNNDKQIEDNYVIYVPTNKVQSMQAKNNVTVTDCG